MKKCQIKTIDARHNKFLKDINYFHNSKEELENDINLLNRKITEYENINKKSLTDEDFEIYSKLKDDLLNKKNLLEKIINKDNVIDYYLDNASILTKYYTSKKKIANNQEKSLEPVNKDCFNKKTIINNVSLLDNYFSNNDDNYIKKLKANDTNICKNCNIEMTIYNIECVTECPKCGVINYIIIDSSKPNYKDPPPEVSYFAYKRINHFNEWLCQFQGKETTDIPEEVYNKIILEIKKERIKNMANITPQKIRQYLKKLKLNKYYEHTTHIINRLNGISAPIINKETENKLRRMFKDIQEPFIKVCPKDRKNFLSYSYVLHKFVELLELHELKKYFPLLKSREKLHLQDIIWKDICKILEWPFYKSI